MNRYVTIVTMNMVFLKTMPKCDVEVAGNLVHFNVAKNLTTLLWQGFTLDTLAAALFHICRVKHPAHCVVRLAHLVACVAASAHQHNRSVTMKET